MKLETEMQTIKWATAAAIYILAAAGPASAQNATSDTRANCQASFHIGCPTTTTTSTTSTGTTIAESPLPLLAASPLALRALGIALYARRRRHAQA